MEVGEDKFSPSFKTTRPLLRSTYVLKRGTAYRLRVGPVRISLHCTLAPIVQITLYLSLEATSTVQRSSTFLLLHISERYETFLSARRLRRRVGTAERRHSTENRSALRESS